MRVPVQLKIPAPQRPVWWQSMQQIYQQLARAVNGNVSIIPQNAPALTLTNTPLPGDNVANSHAIYVTGTAGSDDVITHNLGRVPFGFHVTYKSASVDVYNSPTANTSTKIYLRSTVAGVTVKVMVY
jgi:hypothetical protein